MALRILIVAHDFPPLNSSASRRPYSWARTWTDMGHDVHVLTTAKYAHDQLTDVSQDMSGFTVHAVPYLPWVQPMGSMKSATSRATDRGRFGHSTIYDIVRHLTRRLRLGLGMFTEKTTLAYFSMVRAGKKLLRENDFDLIVSTSGPDMCPMVGAALARWADVKWLSDYRDLWFDEFAVNRYACTTWFVNRLQSALIRRADMVSTVSVGLAEYLERIAPGRVLVCYNGYLGEAAGRTHPARNASELRVVYTGTCYPEKRDPARFFAGLVILARRSPLLAARIKVEFYGPTEAWVLAQVHRQNLGSQVTFQGSVSYAESLAAQGAADLLLFIDWMDDRADGVLTGKLFEYLASGRAILCIGSRENTEAARMIGECNAGQVAVGAEHVADSLASILLRPSSVIPNAARIHSFSRYAQADQLLATVAARLGLPASSAQSVADNTSPKTYSEVT